MCNFARKPKTVRMAAPDDVLNVLEEWPPEELAKPVNLRKEPRVRLDIRPGAATMDFELVPLTMADRETADAMLDAVMPPPVIIEEPSDRPGQPPKRIPSGYDDQDPKYLAALRPLEDKRAAFVTLKGVVGLAEDTPGTDDAAKTDALMKSMPQRILRFLAAEIWNMTYAQGDPADFFTSAACAASPSSEPLPSKSRSATRLK